MADDGDRLESEIVDDAANRAGDGRITAAGSRPAAWVIPTDEERMIALDALALLAGVRR